MNSVFNRKPVQCNPGLVIISITFKCISTEKNNHPLFFRVTSVYEILCSALLYLCLGEGAKNKKEKIKKEVIMHT